MACIRDNNMLKNNSIFILLFLLLPSTIEPYLIIWDLGDTLIYVSIFGMVTEIGLPDCAIYHLFHTKKKDQLQNLIFDVLEEYGGKQTGPDLEKSYHTAHRALPQVMCDWLAGKILEPAQLVKKIHRKIEKLNKKGYFKNTLEYRIIKNAVASMFNPEVLIRNTKILPQALEMVQEIAYQGKHQQTIISNWDGVSYTNFKQSLTGKELSRYFDMNSIIISGSLKIIKPDQSIFDECLDRYGITADQCIFIDDQEENVNAARRYGFIGLHIKNHDFKQLRKELVALGVL